MKKIERRIFAGVGILVLVLISVHIEAGEEGKMIV